MKKFSNFVFVTVLILFKFKYGNTQRILYTTDELENHISPEDLKEFIKWGNKRNDSTTTRATLVDYASYEDTTTILPVPDTVDCFGLGSLQIIQEIWPFNMRPSSSNDINTHFYFSSRQQPNRVQVFSGPQFGLEWVDFNPNRRTILIVHGFMSHSNASWVRDMTAAFLEWADVNVIAADWSAGGNTWKYWRAVANTRRVGSDITDFMNQLMSATGAKVKDFHFVGHSLGAHIVSYVSYHIGRVSRITGLDPAQPCFRTTNLIERLDETDADFVDVIHTNGRLLQKIGFGLPDPIGHADFYPNGGMRQPGCANKTNSIWSRLFPVSVSLLQQAICSHGRAYLLFTESLISNNCMFRAYQWNLTYEGVNASLQAACSKTSSLCSVMGIQAMGNSTQPRAKGGYFVLTSEKQPYCRYDISHPIADLLRDLRQGFRLDRMTKPKPTVTPAYADPDLQTTTEDITTTTSKSWIKKLFSFG
ncbi:pancreatic triacylglycerol lipase-like [Melitaea cinxia]|uniref:pancreatic triacylglycerol lipase-like n=1 Tax=Melitaea cinxia TaxID=113334 RepID=UPI001E2734AF|nr:pancreatic triacylglycerol lipase-like [Melitaea cinxia]